MDWERLHLLPAPYVPRVDHDLDTQNFEHFDEEPHQPGHNGPAQPHGGPAPHGAEAAHAAAGQQGHGHVGSLMQGADRKWLAKADPHFIGYTYKSWEAVTPDSECL